MNRLRAGRVHAPGTEAVRSLNQGPLVSLSSLTATLQRLSSNCSPPFPEYLKKVGSGFLHGQSALRLISGQRQGDYRVVSKIARIVK